MDREAVNIGAIAMIMLNDYVHCSRVCEKHSRPAKKLWVTVEIKQLVN